MSGGAADWVVGFVGFWMGEAKRWMVGLVDGWIGAGGGEIGGLPNLGGPLAGGAAAGIWVVVGSTGFFFSFRSSPNIFNNLVIITSAVLALAFRKP